MEILSRKEFEKLAAVKGENCVSIYIPTHRAGKEVTSGKDALAFKNQLQKVKNTLLDRGMQERDVKEFLEQAYKLHDDSGFWHKQLEGLAVFIGEKHFSYHRLPIACEEFCSVTTTFNLLPLVPLFSDDGLYFVLAISRDKVRLFEATRYSIHEVDTGDTLQQGIIEVFKYYDFETGGVANQSSSQGGGRMIPGSGSAVQGGGGPNPSGNRGGGNFHGQGDNKPDKNRPLIIEYFRNINEGLRHYIHNDRIPLVLATVDYQHQMFKEAANGFPYNLMEKGVVGNPDEIHAKELHKKSLECVEGYFTQEREKSKKAYSDLAGTGRTSYDINEIVPAAMNGRIDSLFVADGSHRWGRFDTEKQDVELHDDFRYGDDDLVSRSAVQTILNSGQTFVVNAEDLPDKTVKAEMVAILRY